MNFFKQIIAETKNMLRSKFILISGILMFAFICIAIPIFFAVSQNQNDGSYWYRDDVTINGVTVKVDNQYAEQLAQYVEMKEYYSEWVDSAKALEYADGISDALIDFYFETGVAAQGMPWNDYRSRFAYEIAQYITELYVLELDEFSKDEMISAINAVSYIDTEGENSVLNLEGEEKLEKIEQNKEYIEGVKSIIVDNDFGKYVDIKKTEYQNIIEENEKQIKLYEEIIIDNPDQEDKLSQDIENLKMDNQRIVENEMAELDYRLENMVVPGDGSWQDSAISEQNDAKRNLLYFKVETEDDFNANDYLVEQYQRYTNYQEAMEKERQGYEKDLFVANTSLETGKPDMKFVKDGSRSRVNELLSFSIIIAIFGVLVGGCAIANDFQNGTIRLLMIRPRTRLKVLYSKYIAGLSLVYLLYFAVFIVSIIVVGFTTGFADYLNPNYSMSGPINYFAMLFGRIMATSISLVFMYSLAFAFSAIIKNNAVSIIIPTVGILGAGILMQFMSMYPNVVNVLAFTPVPYLYFQDFFGEWTTITNLIEKGCNLSVGLGIAMLLVYSAIAMFGATLIYNKRDITN